MLQQQLVGRNVVVEQPDLCPQRRPVGATPGRTVSIVMSWVSLSVAMVAALATNSWATCWSKTAPRSHVLPLIARH